MAFKTMKAHNEEKFGGLFLLRNDGDYADVIFMYQSENDVLVADTHYIKSASYTGYVHCCGTGCPACAKNIRVQTKLFIPLYNLTDNELQFWDRSTRFENQLMQDVFQNYPNPSEYVFRITRHGAAGSVDTTYSIMVIARNNVKPFGQVLAETGKTFPAAYEQVCREVSSAELHKMINVTSAHSNDVNGAEMPNYQVTPRGAAGYASAIAPTPVAAPAYTAPAAPDFASVEGPAVSAEGGDDFEDVEDDVSF